MRTAARALAAIAIVMVVSGVALGQDDEASGPSDLWDRFPVTQSVPQPRPEPEPTPTPSPGPTSQAPASAGAPAVDWGSVGESAILLAICLGLFTILEATVVPAARQARPTPAPPSVRRRRRFARDHRPEIVAVAVAITVEIMAVAVVLSRS